MIIQVDTDCAQDFGVEVPSGKYADVWPEIVERVKSRLIDAMPAGLYAEHANRIIFAIAVDSIECWLLPLFTQQNKRAKTTGCLGELNQQLKKFGFTIDAKQKNKGGHYQKVVRKIKKRKDVEAMTKHQPSFRAFLDQLPEAVA